MDSRFRSKKLSVIARRVRVCGTLLFSGSVFVGFLLFVSIILPALENKGYARSLCNVTQSLILTDHYHRLNCKCQPSRKKTQCAIYYPCLRVVTSYFAVNSAPKQGLLVKSRRHVGEKCSYTIQDYDCSSENTVYQMLKKFRGKYGEVGKSFPCYVKLGQSEAVLQITTLKREHMINVTLWPCLGMMVGVIMALWSKLLSFYYCGYRYTRTENEDTEPLANSMDS